MPLDTLDLSLALATSPSIVSTRERLRLTPSSSRWLLLTSMTDPWLDL